MFGIEKHVQLILNGVFFLVGDSPAWKSIFRLVHVIFRNLVDNAKPAYFLSAVFIFCIFLQI